MIPYQRKLNQRKTTWKGFDFGNISSDCWLPHPLLYQWLVCRGWGLGSDILLWGHGVVGEAGGMGATRWIKVQKSVHSRDPAIRAWEGWKTLLFVLFLLGLTFINASIPPPSGIHPGTLQNIRHGRNQWILIAQVMESMATAEKHPLFTQNLS